MMMIPSTTLFIFSTLLLVSSDTISAFTIATPRGHSCRVLVPSSQVNPASRCMLFGSKKSKGFAKDVQNGDTAPADDEEEDEAVDVDVDEIVQEAAADANDDDDDDDDATDKQGSEEDQLVASLKEAIHNSESELKAKKATLSRIEEDVEKYTKVGYARRVAQMEDMRRIRMVRICWFLWCLFLRTRMC